MLTNSQVNELKTLVARLSEVLMTDLSVDASEYTVGATVTVTGTKYSGTGVIQTPAPDGRVRVLCSDNKVRIYGLHELNKLVLDTAETELDDDDDDDDKDEMDDVETDIAVTPTSWPFSSGMLVNVNGMLYEGRGTVLSNVDGILRVSCNDGKIRRYDVTTDFSKITRA
jgi:hypothetical protein